MSRRASLGPVENAVLKSTERPKLWVNPFSEAEIDRFSVLVRVFFACLVIMNSGQVAGSFRA